MGGEPWNPWRALRERNHIELRWANLPDGVRGAWWRENGHAVIALAHRLRRRERNAVLAHELVHDERCIAYPPGIIAKEEAIVDRIATRRLVPPDRLAELVDRRVEAGEPVTARVVADEFDVPLEVAERSLRLLDLEVRVGRHGRHERGGRVAAVDEPGIER